MHQQLYYDVPNKPGRTVVKPLTAGERALLPKSDRMAVMVSAMITRDTGFGLQMDATKLAEINYLRRGKKYTDEAAAMVDVLNCTEKKEIKESATVHQYFELGANNEGYWGYNHMVLRLEDCFDCVKVVDPHLDFFLFDHSSRHSKNSGLELGQTNSGFGGRSTNYAE
jgi:hypothetical protein